MRRALLLVLLVLLAPLARGEETNHLAARSELRRRYLWIGADGVVAGVASGASLVARVRRGEATALEQSFSAGGGGAVHVELRTTARLLPDEYVLEIAEGARSLAQAKLRVGAPEEVEPARERLRSWLVNARGALRDLAAFLERRGEFHRRRLLDAGGKPSRALAEAQRAAWNQALDAFAGRYRTARMDFVPYEREVLLSPFDEAGSALSSLFPLLLARRDELKAAFDEALAGREAPLSAPEKILDVARRSAKGLGLDAADLAAWSAGPLGAPERAAAAGSRFTSPVGFGVDVPAGWLVVESQLQADPTRDLDRPEDRLVVQSPDLVKFVVRVREMPDVRASLDLARTVEELAWEEWGNYGWKKLDARASDRRYELFGRCVLGQRVYRVIIVELAPAAGGRLVELRAICPESAWEARKADLDKLAQSFAVDEKK